MKSCIADHLRRVIFLCGANRGPFQIVSCAWSRNGQWRLRYNATPACGLRDLLFVRRGRESEKMSCFLPCK